MRQRVGIITYIEFDYQCEQLNPLRAGCHIEVPREIATKRAVISVRTTDNACLAWSVVAALYPTEKYTKRESSYPHYTTVLNLTNIEFPMTLKDISKFERLNAVSINVYGIENKSFFCGSPITRKRSSSISCIYKIHTTTTLAILRGSRTRVSWDRKLSGKRTRSFFVIDKYNKKSQ